MPVETFNAEKFWQASDRHLIRYAGGGSFCNRIIVKAQGCTMWDHEGKEIIDWTSGQMSSMLGHGHPEIVQTVTDLMATLDHLFSGFITRPVVDAAEMLASLLPPSLSKIMFLNTGAESNEAALRIAKLYTGKHEVVAFSASWHGMTQGAAAATFSAGRKGYGPVAPGQLVLPTPNALTSPFRKPDGSYDWQTELDYGWQLIDCQSTGSLAAVMIEPILSSGGVIELPDGYLAALKAHCTRRGALLIIDEAQTGIGRTGDMFAFERDGVVPDILTLSKTLGCGLPVAATCTSPEIEAEIAAKGFLFYTTHVSDPLAAGVALKAMQIVTRDQLHVRARTEGARVKAGLRALQSRYKCIGDVRGRGLLMGVEIVVGPGSDMKAHELGAAISDKCMDLGLSMNIVRLAHMGGVFRIAPPLIATNDDNDRALAILDAALAAVKGTNW